MDAGTLVGGRFEIVRQAASGGMGAVYRALDRTTGAPAAVKIVRVTGRDVTERLIREGRALAQLDHPHVVKYLAHGTTPDGDPFLAMEWVEGSTLSRRLARQPMAIHEALGLVLRVAEALGHAHAKGIVHRDVKPGNLILRNDDPSQVVLVDFGVARGRRDDGLTLTGMIVGTPTFMSPEQARGARSIEPSSDVFALGCLIYRCLTGRNAFEGDDQVAVLAKVLLDDPPPLAALVRVDPSLDALARRFLAKDPAQRPQNGSIAAEAIRALAEQTHVETDSQRSVILSERLTLTERRLVSLVLARTPIDPEATMAGDEENGGIGPIRAIAMRHGALCEVLANGMLVVAMTGRGSATDQAAQAATCALELKAAMRGPPLVLVTGRAVVEGTESSVATGITRGGGADVFDFAAVLAARLEAIGEHECIVVDETTAGLLDRSFVVGPHRLGLELRGKRAEGTDGGKLLGKVTACVGRERELSTLEALLTECESEPVARAALVTAQPGMGKSRLLREFVARTGSRAQVLHATADAIASGSPFAVLAQAVRTAAGIESEDPPEARARKLRARIARHVQRREVERTAEFLGEAAGIVGEPSARVLAARADPRLMTEQMRSAWVEWLGAECAAKPLLLVLDDVQWADIVSLRLVTDALSTLPDSPLCVLLVGRPEARDALPEVLAERAVPVPLGALSRKASEKLVREALEGASNDTVAKIVARAGGQPLLLEELVRAHADGHEDGTATAAVAMVQSRLETLDPESRRVLRAASVFGEVFWRAGVEHLLSTSVAAQLEIVEAKELVARRPSSRYANEQELAFRHALVKDAAYAMLTAEDAALGHRLAAEWLSGTGETNPLVLAEHWARSDRPKDAVPYLIRAAEVALEVGDFAGVAEHASRAKAIGVEGFDLGRLLYLEAEGLRWKGDTLAAEKMVLSALDELPVGCEPWLHAVRVASFCSGLLGHLDLLVSLVERLLECRPGADTARAWALTANQAASNLLIASPNPLAYDLLARTEGVPKETLERDPVAAMYHFQARSAAAFRDGHYEKLLEATKECVAHAERAGDVRFATFHLTNVGFAYGQLGDYEKSVETFERGRADALRHGISTAVLTLDQNRGHALMCLGRLEEARAVEEDVAKRAKDQAPRLFTIANACLARIFTRLGDFDRAVRAAEVGVEAAPTLVPKIYALACLGEALLARGDAEEALTAAHSALSLALELGGGHVGDVLAGRVQVEALVALGRRDDARRVLEHPVALVRGRAASIRDPELRQAMLERVEDHRKVLELERMLKTTEALGA